MKLVLTVRTEIEPDTRNQDHPNMRIVRDTAGVDLREGIKDHAPNAIIIIMAHDRIQTRDTSGSIMRTRAPAYPTMMRNDLHRDLLPRVFVMTTETV